MFITFITSNNNKLKEVQSILNTCNFNTMSLDLPEIQGDPEEIAIEKCKYALNVLKCPVLIEDTCLCFHALQNLPGPYIKWFFKKLKNDGLIKLLSGFEDKSAHALCIFALGIPDKEPILFIAKTNGQIVPPRGSEIFGWDPIFQPNGYNCTYAEMDNDKKNKISHRFKALVQLKLYLNEINKN